MAVAVAVARSQLAVVLYRMLLTSCMLTVCRTIGLFCSHRLCDSGLGLMFVIVKFVKVVEILQLSITRACSSVRVRALSKSWSWDKCNVCGLYTENALTVDEGKKLRNPHGGRSWILPDFLYMNLAFIWQSRLGLCMAANYVRVFSQKNETFRNCFLSLSWQKVG